MKTEITRDEYELLTFLKSAQDQLERLSSRFYFYARKILKDDEDGWLTDYFNDEISVTELLANMNIDVKKT